jgi:hypothetical protein
MSRLLALAVCGALALSPAVAHADDYVITLQHNQFSPQELTIPAHQKVKVTVKNLDATPAEFESYELNREKVVTANGEIGVFVGPLEPGSYPYFDDFHRDSTKGVIIAK